MENKFISLFCLNRALDAVTELLQSLDKSIPRLTNHHNSNKSKIGKMKRLLESIWCQ